MKSLSHHLLGQTRSAILSVLLLRPEASLHVREIARLTGAHAGSLHRELRTLAEFGVLLRDEVGRQVHYRANTDCPVFLDLAGLLRKTTGLVDVLRSALQPLSERIEFAFIHGSMARGNVHVHSDVDVMVVGDVGFADVVLALESAQDAVGREINPIVLAPGEFQARRNQRDSFVDHVLQGPKLWLIGDTDGLG